jgi:uncharacterized protein (TIGR03435 family)
MKFLYGLFLTAALFGQAKPEFEVASIKPSTAAPEGVFNLGVHIDGAQVRCTYMSLKDYIVRAYQIKSYQFSGPDCMASQRFDISAKLPAGASRDQVPAMLKALLDDRFQIKTHASSKEFAVYALTVGKGGLKMKESPLDEAAGPAAVNVDVHAGAGNTMVDLGKGASISFGEDRLDGKKLTMTIFADQLARFVDRPVVDMTGLQGTYDLSLQFQRDDFRPMRIRAALAAGVQLPPQALRLLENASDGPLLTAIQTLGLKLESRKAPLDVLVVDSALKSPTEN